MKRLLKEIGEHKFPDDAVYTHVLNESRAGVPSRRWKVDRWGERVIRDGHGAFTSVGATVDGKGILPHYIESTPTRWTVLEWGLGTKETERGRYSGTSIAPALLPPALMSPSVDIKRLIRNPSSISQPAPLSAREFPFVVSWTPYHPIIMPLVQKQPRGQVVRLPNACLYCLATHKKQTRAFIEGYHFGPLWSRRKVV